ncbi:hypothetical protein SAY87_002041 [Trapa incisa]|uniref:Uncharacterized protein n=1 Tax=Trapa incisa TaxID=236973 RepID=A0AAN7JV55_9MYRT|nr:hypothetical protein SAY87_002041 [Trapa incisa]
MSKDSRERSVSSDRCRASPFRCSSSKSKCPSSKIYSETEANIKEWEGARCPVCIEHPHNAVLLMCTSHDKGCRPYMCDTSYRHSNCLDQFRKSFSANPSTIPSTPEQDQNTFDDEDPSSGTPQEPQLGFETSPQQEPNPSTNSILSPETPGQHHNASASVGLPTELTITGLHIDYQDGPASVPCENPAEPKLLCPLCRGQIKEWVVVEGARRFMNAKLRSCASETCEYMGTYTDLRKHARLEHPLVRPTKADPERQRNWRRLERQRDFGDLLSTLQSSFTEEHSEDGLLPMDERGWLTVFFLIRVFRPESSSRSSSSSGITRARAQLRFRRRLWGEGYDGERVSFSSEDDNESSGDEAGTWGRQRQTRRRTNPDEQL